MVQVLYFLFMKLQKKMDLFGKYFVHGQILQLKDFQNVLLLILIMYVYLYYIGLLWHSNMLDRRGDYMPV